MFDWDALLSEGGPSRTSSSSPTFSRRRIVLPSQQTDERTTILASAFPAPNEAVEESVGAADDPYASAFDSQMQKINTYTEQKEQKGPSFEDRLKNMKDVSSAVVSSKAAFESAEKAGVKLNLKEIYE